jgi:APA family basic amino acid/polyamine antiporter
MSAPAETETGERALKAELGLFAAIALVINATIGTGIFRTPAAVAQHAGSLPAALAVWGAGAAIALAGALSVAELSASLPRAGGIYEPLRRAFGSRVAFVYGFAKITLLAPSAVGSFATLASESIEALLGLSPDRPREIAIALGVLVLALATNLLRVRAAGGVQTAVTAVKYGGLAVLAIAGLALPFTPSTAAAPAANVTLGGVLAALVSVMWAYDGWADLASVAAETRDARRTVPRALVVGTLAVGAIYLAVNFGYARVLGWSGLATAGAGVEMPGARLAQATLGAMGARALASLVVVSCIGGAIASLLTNSRALVPMATDGTFVRALGRVDPLSGTPRTAVVITSVLGALYIVSESFEELTDGFVVGYFPFYALAIIALFVLRRTEPDLPRPFRVPTALPLVFLAGAALVLGGALLDDAGRMLVPASVLLLGVALSFVRRAPASGASP